MKKWTDLTPAEQNDHSEGVVNLYGFEWNCYYKFINEDTVTMFTAVDDYSSESLTHYKSLVALY